MDVSRVETNWNPTCHRSLFHIITDLWSGVRDLAMVVGSRFPANRQGQNISGEPQVVMIGEKMNDVISCLPLSLAINLDNAVCRASVSQYLRY